MTKTNSTEKKEARREWWIRPAFIGQETGTRYPASVSTEFTEVSTFTHVVEAKWRDCAINMANQLEALERREWRENGPLAPFEPSEALEAFEKLKGE